MKFSGYITAQFEGGNLETEYNWGSLSGLATNTLPGTGNTASPFPLNGIPNYPGTTIPITINPVTGDNWGDTAPDPAHSGCEQSLSAEYDLLS